MAVLLPVTSACGIPPLHQHTRLPAHAPVVYHDRRTRRHIAERRPRRAHPRRDAPRETDGACIGEGEERELGEHDSAGIRLRDPANLWRVRLAGWRTGVDRKLAFAAMAYLLARRVEGFHGHHTLSHTCRQTESVPRRMGRKQKHAHLAIRRVHTAFVSVLLLVTQSGDPNGHTIAFFRSAMSVVYDEKRGSRGPRRWAGADADSDESKMDTSAGEAWSAERLRSTLAKAPMSWHPAGHRGGMRRRSRCQSPTEVPDRMVTYPRRQVLVPEPALLRLRLVGEIRDEALRGKRREKSKVKRPKGETERLRPASGSPRDSMPAAASCSPAPPPIPSVKDGWLPCFGDRARARGELAVALRV
ncbi:hypothetical protein B0H19DRAFT_1075944 [Mycena capillaripes]|nr:hypothetical protein B0H19DRAFT_1075944 [Mycena capillaripes]